MTDNTISNLVDRSMKNWALSHANKRMIEINTQDREEKLLEYEKLDSRTLWQVVTILYGEPQKGA